MQLLRSGRGSALPTRLEVISSSLIRHRGSAFRLGHRAFEGELHFAVSAAVAEVDDQADEEPDDQPQPVRPTKAIDHRTADEDARRRNERDRRYLECARQVRTAAAQDPDTD